MSTWEWIGDELEPNQDHRQEDKSEGCCDNEMKVDGSLAYDNGHGVGESWINLGHQCVVEVYTKGKSIQMRTPNNEWMEVAFTDRKQ